MALNLKLILKPGGRRVSSLTSLTLVFLILTFTLCVAYGENLESRIREVYGKLVDAEAKGADVDEEALKLDKALQLIIKAQKSVNSTERNEMLAEAEMLIDEVEDSIPKLIMKGEAKARFRLIYTAVALSSMVAASILLYVYGPRILWKLWIRARRDWKVRRR